jgi:putative endonuclease
MAYLYILYSQKLNRYYIGSTSDFERRLSEHNRGQTTSTRSGMPWELKFLLDVGDIKQAKDLEFKLKRWKSRKLIERVILDQTLSLVESAPTAVGKVNGLTTLRSINKNLAQ